MCVALFFIFFILQSDKEQISNSLHSHFKEFTNINIMNNSINSQYNKNHNSHLTTLSSSSTSSSSSSSSATTTTTTATTKLSLKGGGGGNIENHEIHPDKCVNEWTNDKLIGRCFGLKSHSEYEQLKNIHFVDSSQHCRELCCTLGNECLTWQYWIDNKICKLGGLIRLGAENLNTANWCDPEGPVTWTGKRIESKNGVNSETEGILTTQCFGLGPMKTIDGKISLGKDECSYGCLQLSDCKIWQWHEKRGCYYTNNPQVYCDPYAGGYDGGRKILRQS